MLMSRRPAMDIAIGRHHTLPGGQERLAVGMKGLFEHTDLLVLLFDHSHCSVSCSAGTVSQTPGQLIFPYQETVFSGSRAFFPDWARSGMDHAS